jgi:hypothetical protein
LMSIPLCQFCGEAHDASELCEEAFEAGMDTCYGCGELHFASELKDCLFCAFCHCHKAECRGVCECTVYSVAEQLVMSATAELL